ncbi:hypothetical protein RQP46_010915 [Phenoliferia psychrophenolica]
MDSVPDEDEPLFSSSSSPTDDATADVGRDSLYSVLNLARDSSSDDIQKAYKRLAALLHPDRHPDPQHKDAADRAFQALQRAYEVLIDPQQRAVYDSLGEEGLKTTWEVGTKGKSAQELRAEFERLGRKQLEANLEQLVKSKGELTCTADARVLFLSTSERVRLGGPPHLSLAQRFGTVTNRQLFLKHSFTTPINPSTSVVLTSQLLARQGVGAGNLVVKLLHRPSSKLTLELGTTALRPRACTFKASYAPDLDSFITLDASAKDLSIPPPLNLTIGRRVSELNTATFTLRSGIYSLGPWGRASLEPFSSSSFTLGLINASGWSLHATSGLFASSLSTDYGTTILSGVKLRVGASLSSQGGALSTYVRGERRVTENVKLAMGLDLAMEGTMTVKLSFMRLGQKLVLPIIVSSSFDPTLAVAFTVLPALSIVAANHFVVAPRKRRRISAKITELRAEHAEFIAERRMEARDAVALLEEHARKKMEQERNSNGLVILEATYGVLESRPSALPPTGEEEKDPRWLDVTVTLSTLVTNSQLVIPSGRSKAALLGFYDCAMGEPKTLRIRYLFKGREHLVEVEDTGAVAAPLRAHVVG